jgi:chemotaxis protein CheX
MDITLAKPFVKATVDVLSTMAMIQPTAGKPFVKKDNVAHGDVTGIVGITGEKNGSISVTFTKPCAIAIVQNMLGGEIGDLLSDVRDAVGEITNMISGQARRGLSEMGHVFQAATPSVIMGNNHTIAHVTSGPIMAVPFTTEHGEFTVEVCFEGA